MFDHMTRLLLASILIFSGCNYFFNWLPVPIFSVDGQQFIMALKKTTYMLPLIKGAELLAGFLILSNRFVLLGCYIVIPIIFNIVLFHVFLDSNGLYFAILLAGLIGSVVAFRWNVIKALFQH